MEPQTIRVTVRRIANSKSIGEVGGGEVLETIAAVDIVIGERRSVCQFLAGQTDM